MSIQTTEQREPFSVYVMGEYNIVAAGLTFDQHEALERFGFVEIWDSAPTEFDGMDYAARHYGAFCPFEIKGITR